MPSQWVIETLEPSIWARFTKRSHWAKSAPADPNANHQSYSFVMEPCQIERRDKPLTMQKILGFWCKSRTLICCNDVFVHLLLGRTGEKPHGGAPSDL